MTLKDRFKVAFLTRLVDTGRSVDEIADLVATLHGQLTKAAMGMAPAPAVPVTPAAAVKPIKAPMISSTPKMAALADYIPSPSNIADFGNKSLDLVKNMGMTGLGLSAGAGLAGGYALGKMTDADDTDVEEIKQRELIDMYRRWGEHARQTQSMHAAVRSAAKPHFGGRF